MDAARHHPTRARRAGALPLRAALPFASRRGVLFVGNVNNPTNLHGLRWFVTAVMPLLRRVEPNLRLTVAGSWTARRRADPSYISCFAPRGVWTCSGPPPRPPPRACTPAPPLHPTLSTPSSPPQLARPPRQIRCGPARRAAARARFRRARPLGDRRHHETDFCACPRPSHRRYRRRRAARRARAAGCRRRRERVEPPHRHIREDPRRFRCCVS